MAVVWVVLVVVPDDVHFIIGGFAFIARVVAVSVPADACVVHSGGWKMWELWGRRRSRDVALAWEIS